MASRSTTLAGWAKRVLARPVAYEHVPEDDILMARVAWVSWEYHPSRLWPTDDIAGHPQQWPSPTSMEMLKLQIARSGVQLATMDLKMPITWLLRFMMTGLPRKSVKAFAELQISCRGRFGMVHLAMLPTSTSARIFAYKWIQDRGVNWTGRESCILWGFRAIPKLHPKYVQESFRLARCPWTRAVRCYEVYQLLPVLLLCYTCFWFVVIIFTEMF